MVPTNLVTQPTGENEDVPIATEMRTQCEALRNAQGQVWISTTTYTLHYSHPK
jgi:hypothetical protein